MNGLGYIVEVLLCEATHVDSTRLHHEDSILVNHLLRLGFCLEEKRKKKKKTVYLSTPGPRNNMLLYITVLDITLITVGLQLLISNYFCLFLLYFYTFYSRYNTVWIANTEIGLDPNNSVIKRLWLHYSDPYFLHSCEKKISHVGTESSLILVLTSTI